MKNSCYLKCVQRTYRINTPIQSSRFSEFCVVKEKGCNISFYLYIDNSYKELFTTKTGDIIKDFKNALGDRYGRL